MNIYNKTDMVISVPLVGDAGNTESVTLQPHGRVTLPEGFRPAREMPQLHVTDDFSATADSQEE